ncbi:DUF4350 domain-containing protein [Tamlana sp. 2_MG-2023]|uniref:DUF4350 domain-containing protein n=1 Tax=unclassified Tamlana TaxID=2614803 RepID=UPI0026E2C13C|nr:MULTISPECIES: DUF4350 domain-containing protein [unclassified Tamlana]MDO6759509.1 DUF4350 domain-containing protein [Tamlana sp. 2_MG-2023]MDO6790352.1 DUF4350 domain-containing protein [Tamlana sp. 1_MG-2023]
MKSICNQLSRKNKFRVNSLLAIIMLLIGQALTAQNVVYVYGDISAKGKVPSGESEPFHQMRLNDKGRYGMSQFKTAIAETGLHITEVYDAATTFDASFLKNVDVLILGSNQKKFSETEINSIHKWVEQGGGLIAWSDSAFGGHYEHVGLANTLGRDSDNQITEAFGMHFLTDNGAGNYLITTYTKDHFINNNNKDGGVRFRGEGVSFVRVSPPAIVLAKAQDHGLGGQLRVNKVDGVFNPETDVTLAIATIKKGRALGLFDRNMMWNAGDGSQITHSDNKEFAQRMVLWAAGIEDNSRIPKKDTSKKTGINLPPKVSVQTDYDSKNTVSFIADIEDSDTDNIYPEITWVVKKGPKVTFENNNPNTKTPVVTLSEKGTYLFMAIISDGEFKITKRITINKTE